MSDKAVRTRIAEPSVSRTFLYREKTAMPGPIAACARSTGAIFPFCKFRSAAGISRFIAARKSLRVVMPADSGRGLQTRTIEDAKALVPLATGRLLNSLRIGQVPVT